METETKAKKTRAKAEYWIEAPQGDGFEFTAIAGPLTGNPLGSVAEAKKNIKKSGVTGKLRIVRVCWTGEVKTETKTITRLT